MLPISAVKSPTSLVKATAETNDGGSKFQETRQYVRFCYRDILGLQINGVRATRARYPNLNGGIEVSCGYGCLIDGADL